MPNPVVILAAAACLAPAPKPAAPDYYPLKAGTKWHYQVTVGNETLAAVNVAREEETVNGVKMTRVETVIDGKTVASEHLAATPDGVFRHRYNGVKCVPPVRLLSYPVKDDDSWEMAVTIGTEKATMAVRVGTAEVEVPAGKYRTVTARLTADTADGPLTTEYWFADGFGVVKQVGNLGGVTFTIELEKVELAGK